MSINHRRGGSRLDSIVASTSWLHLFCVNQINKMSSIHKDIHAPLRRWTKKIISIHQFGYSPFLKRLGNPNNDGAFFWEEIHDCETEDIVSGQVNKPGRFQQTYFSFCSSVWSLFPFPLKLFCPKDLPYIVLIVLIVAALLMGGRPTIGDANFFFLVGTFMKIEH